MSNKKVSLVVLNYNGKEYLEECFSSIFSQTSIPHEIFLMDNGSSDGSVEFIKRKFPKVKIIEEKTKNFGTAGSSNIAFSKTSGDFVIFQSNDIKLDKNCVCELVRTLEQNPQIGICTSVLLNYKTHLIDNAGGDADIFAYPMQKYPNRNIRDIPDTEEVFFSYGGSFIVRRKIFEKAGGLDARYFTLNDDVDFCWRAGLLGFKIVYNKKSFVYHKVSATLGKLYDRPIKHYWSERNTIRTFLKNQDLFHLILFLPLYFIIFFGEIAYLLFRGKFSLAFADLKAILWNIIYLPETLLLRFKIQSGKTGDVYSRLKKTSYKLHLFHDFSKVL